MKQFILCKLSLLLSCGLCLLSCKKDKDTLKPTLYISNPHEDESYSVFEEVTVKVSIEDETQLDQIKIVLQNEHQVAVLPAINITPADKKVFLVKGIALDDIRLETGYYYIMVSASDGINRATAFRKIYITEAPKERKGVFIVSTPSTNSTGVYRIDSTFQNISPYLTLTSDYIGSSVSSYYQTLNMLGHISGDFNCYNLSNKTLKWSIASSNGAPFPTFNNIVYSDKINYVSYYDGDLKGYGDDGSIKFNAVAFSGYNPLKLIQLKNNIVSAQKAYTGTDKKLVTYIKGFGSQKHDVQINFDVIDFCQREDNNIVVFGNVGSQGVVKIYESETNNLWEPLSLPSGEVYSAIRINDENYLLAHQSGIYKYHFSANGVLAYLPGITASKIVYDEVNNDIMVVSGTTVSFYDYPSASLKFSFTHSETIADAHLLFNK